MLAFLYVICPQFIFVVFVLAAYLSDLFCISSTGVNFYQLIALVYKLVNVYSLLRREIRFNQLIQSTHN